MIRTLLAMMIVLLGSPFSSSPANADVLEWRMKSDYRFIVYVRFFSNKYERAWPGGDESYVLDDSDRRLMRLSCEQGEKICFGAFTKNQSGPYWGVGRYGDEGCEKCCRTCGFTYDGIDVLN